LWLTKGKNLFFCFFFFSKTIKYKKKKTTPGAPCFTCFVKSSLVEKWENYHNGSPPVFFLGFFFLFSPYSFLLFFRCAGSIPFFFCPLDFFFFCLLFFFLGNRAGEKNFLAFPFGGGEPWESLQIIFGGASGGGGLVFQRGGGVGGWGCDVFLLLGR